MTVFEVKDMTCGHCVSAITKAVMATDKDAKVHIDLASQRVEIESAASNDSDLRDAIEEAGYTPVVIAAPDAVAAGVASQKSGGCCCASRKAAAVATQQTAVSAKSSANG